MLNVAVFIQNLDPPPAVHGETGRAHGGTEAANRALQQVASKEAAEFQLAVVQVGYDEVGWLSWLAHMAGWSITKT